MDQIDLNCLLNREANAAQFKQHLLNFDTLKNIPTEKTGIYVCGNSGVGKTQFVNRLLKELGYDVVRFDSGDVRNKQTIDDLAHKNMADKNVLSMLHKRKCKIAIVMDEIDGMNGGDKGGINALIKMMRPKKTKKQKLDDVTKNPFICIGNNKADKKIKELMKACVVIELLNPTPTQMSNVMTALSMTTVNKAKTIEFINGDLRKQDCVYRTPALFADLDAFHTTIQNDDAKKTTKKLLERKYSFGEHNAIINETDRTSVGLLWHENVVDALAHMDKRKSIPLYLEQLEHICFADYIDRITFQKQIWQFNEMSSLMKTMHNSKLFHEHGISHKFGDIRFTKALTKSSTEYHNTLFIQRLCQQFGMDKKDLVCFFDGIRDEPMDELLEKYEITKLDINRMYRYIDKYIKEDAPETKDDFIVELETDFPDDVQECAML